MKIRHVVFMSLKNLIEKKTRTILTISGVCIGFGFIVFLLSLGYGIERLTTNQISSPDTLRIFESSLSQDSEIKSINDKKLSEIKNLENVEEVEAAAILPAIVNIGSSRADIAAYACTKEYLKLRETKIATGKFFLNNDSKEVLISKGLQRMLDITDSETAYLILDVSLMTNSDLSPERANNTLAPIRSLRISGVTEDDAQAIFIPLGTVQKNIDLVNYNLARVKVNDKIQMSETRRQLEKLGFTTNYIGDTIAQINGFFTIFRYVMIGFGITAMVVALLGMFNTLTVSLLERTQEIGILKALGAQRKVIWWLFLSESLIIGLSGGFLGILTGSLGGRLANVLFNFYAKQNGGAEVDFIYTPLSLVITMMALSVLVGLATGYYPALRATKIKLLNAIKYE